MKNIRENLTLIEGERKELEYRALKAFDLSGNAFDALLDALRPKGELALIAGDGDFRRSHPLPPEPKAQP